MHRPPLTPKKYSWYSFLLRDWVDPRAIVQPKDYVNEKFQWHYWEPRKHVPVEFHSTNTESVNDWDRMDLKLPLHYPYLSFQPDPTEHDISTWNSSSIRSFSFSICLSSKGNTRFLSSLPSPICSPISSQLLKWINMYLTSVKGKVHTKTGHEGPEGE